MHFKFALAILAPMAMALPAAVEDVNVSAKIPAAIYDLKAWQAVVDEHFASKRFSSQNYRSKRYCYISSNALCPKADQLQTHPLKPETLRQEQTYLACTVASADS
jgi:hypothetical protein